MRIKRLKVIVVLLIIAACGVMMSAPSQSVKAQSGSLNQEDSESENLSGQLTAALRAIGFTGRIESGLEKRLGRKIDNHLADLGRLAFHDSLLGLNDDNSCSGCHAAPSGFGDTQSIAIGVENNNIVGPDRAGPRNQRRAPMILNNVFYPRLMWNSRFASLSGDPFDNSAGFLFPAPEGLSLSFLPHLLTAQAFIPPTERSEMAGFGLLVPVTNDGIRAAVVERLNANSEYRRLFADIFIDVRNGGPITYEMLARAIAEFEFTLAFSDAPIDKFARGDKSAMNDSQKRGALLFFGKAGCVQCHAVSGESNEQFSDFKQHVIGLPQLFPTSGNVLFDGPDANEDFGLEQITGNPADRYAFRTSPLRNVALQPTFFHNGAYTRLEDALRFHLDAIPSARKYNRAQAGVDNDLRVGPIEPVLQRIDPLLATPVTLTDDEFQWLLDFVRDGLHDPRATPERLRQLIPDRLPSGRQAHIFE
ncbi:MAG TPA: cytochrome c peroxidase [Blastocatellia bacterium]|nr:cytochrome c peroxidase [Blastocatellia bacterium]